MGDEHGLLLLLLEEERLLLGLLLRESLLPFKENVKKGYINSIK